MGDLNIIDKSVSILKKYPLCDRCLGRLFGYLGKGMSNLERGKILKSATILEVHRRLKEKELDIETARTILLNAQRSEALKVLGLEDIENEFRQCFICRNRIEELIDSYSQKVAFIIQNLKASSFLVGISSAQEYVSREEIIAREFDLLYRENLKRELKREIGKKVASLINVQPNFDEPEVITIIDLSTGNIEVNYPSLILYGYYWKYGRMISQNIWYTKEGGKKYPLSIEEAIKHVGNLINASNYSIHIAGREDVDVRVLGSGRPLAIEFKVLGKGIDMEFIERELNSVTPWLRFGIKMKVNRGFIIRLKEGVRVSRKIYRAIVFTSEDITPEILGKIEETFKDRVIEQRTPTRVLKRRRDRVRRRKVLRVKTVLLTPRLFEALIECEGGLYIKELISGDNGKTKPSFSEVLGCDTKCVMLDVLYVHEQI